MAGFLGYLSVLADDISSLSGKTIATATKSLVTSLDDVGLLFDDIATYTKPPKLNTTSPLLFKIIRWAKSTKLLELNLWSTSNW